MTVRLSGRGLATVLAALRSWQRGLTERSWEALFGAGHFDEETPLDAQEIDALCERLNVRPDRQPRRRSP